MAPREGNAWEDRPCSVHTGLRSGRLGVCFPSLEEEARKVQDLHMVLLDEAEEASDGNEVVVDLYSDQEEEDRLHQGTRSEEEEAVDLVVLRASLVPNRVLELDRDTDCLEDNGSHFCYLRSSS